MKKNTVKGLIAAVLVLGVGFAFWASKNHNVVVPFLSGSDQSQQKVVTSHEIKVPIGPVNSMNPVNSREETVYYINRLIYEGLFKLDSTLSAVPVLASSYVYDQKEASVTVTLQNGVKWHDGRALDASDVKYSIDSYLASPHSSVFSVYTNKIKSAKVRGDDSITIYFKSSEDMALENLTFPIIPSGESRKAGKPGEERDSFVPVGTGPYMVASQDDVKEIVLEGFSGYHGAAPDNKIIFRVMPDQSESTKLFAINDLSISYSKDMNRDTYLKSKSVELSSFPSNEMELAAFNVNGPVTGDKKVRKALAYAVDSNEILDTGYFKSGVLNDNLYYPGYLGLDSQKQILDYNLDKAKKLLEEAGYTDADGDNVLEDSEGKELRLTLLINSENPSRKIAAQTIQESLDKLLIPCDIEEREWNSYNSAIASGNYDMFIGGYQITDNFDLRFLLHSGYDNPAGYSNTTLDFLLDKMQSGISREERTETYQSIKKIINEDMPYYCMFYKTYGIIASPSLKGEIKPLFFDFYNNCGNWYCEYTEEEKKQEKTETQTAM